MHLEATPVNTVPSDGGSQSGMVVLLLAGVVEMEIAGTGSSLEDHHPNGSIVCYADQAHRLRVEEKLALGGCCDL